MSKKKDLAAAVKLYKSFRDEAPTSITNVTIPAIPSVVMIQGIVTAIEYDTTHGKGETRERKLYRHDFAPGSRPFLAAGPRIGQLYLVGGRYKVTSGGITDLNAHGRIVDYLPAHLCPHCGKKTILE